MTTRRQTESSLRANFATGHVRAGFALLLVAALSLVPAGCENDEEANPSPPAAATTVPIGENDPGPKMTTADVCPHCPGVQKATAGGRCPLCAMKVGRARGAFVDVCRDCPGLQVANRNGACPMCSLKVDSPSGAAPADGFDPAGSSGVVDDVCAECPGVQKSDADGRCAKCAAAGR